MTRDHSGRRSVTDGNVGRAQFHETAEVLDGRDHQELFSRPGEPSELQSREPQMPLHVGKQHLDLSSQSARAPEVIGL